MIKIRDCIPKVLLLSDYEDMVLYQVEILKENAELRKVCQCRECRWYGLDYLERGKAARCYGSKSDNCDEIVNPYSSCKECERR